MHATRKLAPVTGAVLFALAGLAFLVAAALNGDASPLVVPMQAVGAVLFFVVGYVQLRRSR